MKSDKNKKILIIILVAALFVIFAILVAIVLELDVLGTVILYWILTTIYSIFAFYIAGTEVIYKDVKYVEKPVYVDKPVYVNKPVYVDRPIQIPVENKVIEVVERPVEKKVPVYIERKRTKLNIPKYEYVGSDETMHFHKRNCRLSKLIKKKHKVSSNSKSYFISRGYKPCKACLKK